MLKQIILTLCLALCVSAQRRTPGVQGSPVGSTSSGRASIASTTSILKGNGSGSAVAATGANVVSLFSGTCDSTTVLAGDATCVSVSSAFSAVTGGTNTTAAMIVGTGGSLTVSGSGTINATGLGGSAAALYAKLAAPAFTGNASADTNTWCIDSTNHRLGVGTCSPTQLFHVDSSSSGGTYAIFRNTNASGNRNLLITISPDTGPSSLNFTLTGRMEIIANHQFNFVAPNIFFGTNAVASSADTITFQDNTASTGATRVKVKLGAADSTSTAIFTSEGTVKAAGYQSSDGTAGATVTTCTSFKNGLCVAGS